MKAPTGSEIQGTSEMVPGVAGVLFDDSVQGFDYDGSGTNLFWNGGVTQKIAGVALFTDQDGSDWQKHHLIPDDAEPLSDDTIQAMVHENLLGEALDSARKLNRDLEALTKSLLYPKHDVSTLIGCLDHLHVAARKLAGEMREADLARPVL